MTRMRTIGLAIFLAAIAPAAATAQVVETKSSSITVQAGKEARLSTHGIVKKDCTAGPLPEVKATTPPKNGAFVVKTVNLKMNAPAACVGKEGAAQVVFYQAKDGFAGSDSLTYQVKGASGPAQSHTVSVTVTK